jgi:hypothetical protein
MARQGAPGGPTAAPSARRWLLPALAAGAAASIAAGLAGSSLASCAQTPTNVPVQTFEEPRNIDVVCLWVKDANGNAIVPPIPQPQAQCAPVPPNVDGNTLQYHLYALVTQTGRGEVAVVDLTGGYVVDIDPVTPGINFLPVGRLPSDVAVSPDGAMAYVGSAQPNLPALYALPSRLILGDSIGSPADGGPPAEIPRLTTWPVCALPQAPGAIAVLPRASLVGLGPAADAGPAAADAGEDAEAGAPPAPDAGAPAAVPPTSYLLAVVLPGDTSNPARVALVDPTPLTDPAAVDSTSLPVCNVTTYLNLGSPGASTTWATGPAWDDGVKYVDGGLDADQPQSQATCAVPAALADAGGDGGTQVAGLVAGAAPLAGSAALDTSGPRPILYVADVALPLIHRIDLSNAQALTELDPLLVTSAQDPLRAVSVGQIAVSPPTREFKRFLYAIDRKDGSIAVFDVTDPASSPRVPLTRPHPELEPFQPPDRILFSAPVASLAFVRHDWPLSIAGNATAQTGLLCNPNPNAVPSSKQSQTGPFVDNGAYYRHNAASPSQQVDLGPLRIRGIFAFVTLSNGQIVTVDVDDWDAPCRRPDPLADQGTTGNNNTPLSPLILGPFNAIAPPEPPAGPGDLDPYHAPLTFQSAYMTDTPVSLEAFFPVSAPHRARSKYLLRNDPAIGNHTPNLVSPPQLSANGAPVPTQGAQGVGNPNLVPTDTALVDPSQQTSPTDPNPANHVQVFASTDGGAVDASATAGIGQGGLTPRQQSFPDAPAGVRFAWEEPEAQVDQDWSVTYEGAIPGFFDSNGNPLVVANVSSDDGYLSLSLTAPGASFCSKGIEDVAIGIQRAQSVLAAMTAAGLPAPARLDHRTGDYVQLTDDVLDPTDPYWTEDNACWEALAATPDGAELAQSSPNASGARSNLCNQTYGQTLDPNNPSTQRDFPILEAYDGKLVVGRFGYPPIPQGETTPPPREVVGRDGSNTKLLALMQCCFHDQVHFNVRTGSQWVAVGSATGLLSHVIASGSDQRCAPSCAPRDALLNARAPAVPRPLTDPPPATLSIDRDNPLALRNPMFSFVVWDGQDRTNPQAPLDVVPARDMVWHFTTRGQYVPLVINLAATTTVVAPQSMRFIDSLGQLAVIDGASQGLTLIDLNAMAPAHAPYF